jgi:hypothetical protein
MKGSSKNLEKNIPPKIFNGLKWMLPIEPGPVKTNFFKNSFRVEIDDKNPYKKNK